MLYDNDVKKVDKLDRMLFDKFAKDKEDDDAELYFEDFERDYLQHVISPEKLDAFISDIESALEKGDRRGLNKALNVTNKPLLYKGSLVFGINKYLHWFRGNYYQVSHTPDGQYTVESPYFWMDKLLYIVHHNARRTKDAYPGVEEFVLTISALTTGLNYYDAMKRMISTPEGLAEFDTFLATDLKKSSGYEYVFNTKSVLDSFEEYTCNHLPSDIMTENTVLVRREVSNTNLCVLCVDDTHITTVTHVKGMYKVIKFKLPGWYTDDKNVYEEFGGNPYKQNTAALEVMIQFVLYYSGVCVYSIGVCPLGGQIDRKYSIEANIHVITDGPSFEKYISRLV